MKETFIFLSNFSNIPIEKSSVLNDFSIAVIGAIVGAILTSIFVIWWDKRKDKKRLNDLLKTVLNELEFNLASIVDSLNELPDEIRVKFEKAKIELVPMDEEFVIKNLSWRFSKPYIFDAWKGFILSGFLVGLSGDVLLDLYKAYNNIESVNFASQLSMELFKILAFPNRLDETTNKNFDVFCKIGILHQLNMTQTSIEKSIKDLKNIIK